MKLILTSNNYVVFLLAQIAVPFLQDDYFSYSKESAKMIAVNFVI